MASARREIGNSGPIGGCRPSQTSSTRVVRSWPERWRAHGRRRADTLSTTRADRADRGVLCDTDGGPEATTPPSDP